MAKKKAVASAHESEVEPGAGVPIRGVPDFSDVDDVIMRSDRASVMLKRGSDYQEVYTDQPREWQAAWRRAKGKE